MGVNPLSEKVFRPGTQTGKGQFGILRFGPSCRNVEQLLRLPAGSPEEPRKLEQTADVSPQQMQRPVGHYQPAPNFVLTVKIEEGKLTVGATGRPFARRSPKRHAMAG